MKCNVKSFFLALFLLGMRGVLFGAAGPVVETYSINFMWVNKSLDEAKQYIFPAKNVPALYRDYLKKIFTWATLNKRSTVNIWYDSQFVPVKAIANTQSLIDSYVKRHPRIAVIKLQDVRALAKVQENPEVFSDKTPVFFRADLLRILAAVDSIMSGKATYFVYADLDMEPLSEKELFDTQTKKTLLEQGFVMAKKEDKHGELLKYENSFMILSNHKANLLVAIKWAIIDLNIVRAYNALKGDFSVTSGLSAAITPTAALEQIVWDSFRGMIKYFWFLEGRAKLMYNGEDVDIEKYGLLIFGTKSLSDITEVEFLPPYDKHDYGLMPARNMIPTKKVGLPPSKH